MMMMAATVTPVVLKEEEEKSLFLSVPIHPPGSFHPIFLTLPVEKVKKKKKWCADSFMAVGEYKKNGISCVVLVLLCTNYSTSTPPSSFSIFHGKVND